MISLTEFIGNCHPFSSASECWLWNGKTNRGGYGYFTIAGAQERAHRYSYRLFKGTLPLDTLVRHTCDVRSCVNPNHLVKGTPKENTRDMLLRGRAFAKRGEAHFNSVLTDAQVKEIRAKYKDRIIKRGYMKMLAQEYGVTYEHVWAIINRKKRA